MLLVHLFHIFTSTQLPLKVKLSACNAWLQHSVNFSNKILHFALDIDSYCLLDINFIMIVEGIMKKLLFQ